MRRRYYSRGLIFLLVFWFFSTCKTEIHKPITAIVLPELENFFLDGNDEEWKNIPNYKLWADPLGRYKKAPDFESNLKLSWKGNSLNLLVEVTDDSFLSDTLNPWKGDAIEIFAAPFKGSEDILQISIIPFIDRSFIKVSDHSKEKIFGGLHEGIKCVTIQSDHTRITEAEIKIPLGWLGAGKSDSFMLQIYADDGDDDGDNMQHVWYPLGQSYNSSTSMFKVVKGIKGEIISEGTSRLVITDNEKLCIYVFGAKTGDKISIFRNGIFVNGAISSTIHPAEPDTIILNPLEWDQENDSLFVEINDKALFLHELFLAPRIYENVQPKRFEKEIRNFVYQDRIAFPDENSTLFIGSSSIVRYETLKKDFPELNIIQRGFGGSTSQEALMYMDQIVLPYKPSKIVYYEGDNDVSLGLSPEEIRDNVKEFINKVSNVLPETKIFILSPKPSINRMNLWEKYKQTNKLLAKLADQYNNVEFIDVATPMFNKSGKLDYSLFIEDGIHMNSSGYTIWTSEIRKALKLDN